MRVSNLYEVHSDWVMALTWVIVLKVAEAVRACCSHCNGDGRTSGTSASGDNIRVAGLGVARQQGLVVRWLVGVAG